MSLLHIMTLKMKASARICITFAFIFIPCLYSIAFCGPKDSVATNRIVHQQLQLHPDTALVQVIGYHDPNFIEKIAGYLIPTLLSIAVALITLIMTQRAEKRRRSEEERRTFRGVLAALKEEVGYHAKILPFLQDELKGICASAIFSGSLPYSGPKRTVNSKFLREIRTRIVGMSVPSGDLLKLLSAYINSCDLVNTDLDFDWLRAVSNQAGTQQDKNKMVNGYFEEMIQHVKDQQTGASGLVQLIDYELQQLK